MVANYFSNSIDCHKYRILLAWISSRDFHAYQSNQTLSPIICALKSSRFDRVILIGVSPNDIHYAEWLENQFVGIQVQLIYRSLTDNYPRQNIYINADLAVQHALLANKYAELVFCLSASQPVNTAMWLLLRQRRYPKAQLIHTCLKNGIDIIEPIATTDYYEYDK